MYRQAKEFTVGLLSPTCPRAVPAMREWWGLCFAKKSSNLITVKSEKKNFCALSEWSEIVDFSLDSEFPLMRSHAIIFTWAFLAT